MRWLAVAAVLVLVVVGAWLLVRTLTEPVDETWERILETRVLRVCTDPSWPPFEYIRPGTGQVDGFDIELAGLLAERMAPGLRVEVVSVGFDGLYDALLAGRCDAVLSALPYDPLRTEDVVYSVAYFNAGQVLLTRADETGIEGLDDLPGRVVGVEWGFVPQGDSRQRDLLRNLPARRYDTRRGNPPRPARRRGGGRHRGPFLGAGLHEGVRGPAVRGRADPRRELYHPRALG